MQKYTFPWAGKWQINLVFIARIALPRRRPFGVRPENYLYHYSMFTAVRE